MQNCWLILGELYYHYEATDFLEPVTEDLIGPEMYEDYCKVISEPMDIGTVIQKMKSGAYHNSKDLFRQDIELIFTNCRLFNEEDTEIVNCAKTLSKKFKELWINYRMYG